MLTGNLEVLIVGGGLAGLSAAIYLGRAKRKALVVDEGRSMARWEPEVENYLGFPEGIDGQLLVRRGRAQARRYGIRFVRDRIVRIGGGNGSFRVRGQKHCFSCQRLLLATGIYHVPPDLPHLKACLGRSMFFCKDCDGFRVRGRRIGIYGWTNEAVEYALGMLLYSPKVLLLTDGREPKWDSEHARWVREYRLPVHTEAVTALAQHRGRIRHLTLARRTEVELSALFIIRGDIYYNELARGLGAKLDHAGQIIVDADMRTTVQGLYAAGCVTPANCQMIIAAGEGAAAAQAINRDLFQESLLTHRLRRFRWRQLRTRRTQPKHHKVPAPKERG